MSRGNPGLFPWRQVGFVAAKEAVYLGGSNCASPATAPVSTLPFALYVFTVVTPVVAVSDKTRDRVSYWRLVVRPTAFLLPMGRPNPSTFA